MQILLQALPETFTHYTGKPVPKWQRMLAPDAAASIIAVEKEIGPLRYTDMWRSAEVSLAARASKTGVQAPGFSAHNYGFSIDFDVEGNMKLHGWSYDKFRDLLNERGWYGHRMDGSRGSEEWHFNYFGPTEVATRFLAEGVKGRGGTWALPVELKMKENYGAGWVLSTVEIQEKLKELKMYHGDVDGIVGPLTREALKAFQRAWDLIASGTGDERTQRTLAFVTATKKMVT